VEGDDAVRVGDLRRRRERVCGRRVERRRGLEGSRVAVAEPEALQRQPAPRHPQQGAQLSGRADEVGARTVGGGVPRPGDEPAPAEALTMSGPDFRVPEPKLQVDRDTVDRPSIDFSSAGAPVAMNLSRSKLIACTPQRSGVTVSGSFRSDGHA